MVSDCGIMNCSVVGEASEATLTVHEADKPLSVVTVICTVPSFTPVTTHPVLTVAMPVLDERHVTFDDEPVGYSVYESLAVPLGFTESSLTDNSIRVGDITDLTTLTVHEADLPLAVVAVICAVPSFTPVTTPSLVTVAMLELDDCHVTVDAAFEGDRV